MSCDPNALRSLLRLGLPAQIGPHEVIRELGRGGMGQVYLVRQGVPDRLVALKRLSLPSSLSAQQREEAVRRFGFEVEAAGRLRHDNIVGVYDGSGLQNSPPYFLMQFIDGETLAAPGCRQRFGEPQAAAKLIAQVARAVHYGHQHGVLHRDLKPANILVEHHTGRPFVADFGIAVPLGDPSNTRTNVEKTETCARTGSPGYMAPELLTEQPEEATLASDIYSLGVILFELLTEQADAETNPFGPARAEALRRLGQRKGAVDICAACSLALRSSPDERYPSALDFAVDLERAVSAQPLHFCPTSLPRRLRLWTKRHPISAIGGMALSSILLVTGVSMAIVLAERATNQKAALTHQKAEAVHLARRIGEQLESAADRLREFSRREQVTALIQNPNSTEVVQEGLPTGFIDNSTLTLIDLRGRIVARWSDFPPPESSYFEQDFSWRDYFQTPLRLNTEHGEARSLGKVYLAHPIHSYADKLFKSALSTLVAHEHQRQGVLLLTLPSGDSLHTVQMAGSPRLVSSLLAPLEADDNLLEGAGPLRLSVVLHAGLKEGQTLSHSGEVSAGIWGLFPDAGQRFEAWRTMPEVRVSPYNDLASGFQGPRTTAFARVGTAPYIVAVQHPHDDLQREQTLDHRLFEVLAWGGGATAICVLLLIGLSARSNERQS